MTGTAAHETILFPTLSLVEHEVQHGRSKGSFSTRAARSASTIP